ARTADAFPWMIRHGYSGCVPCHADPSGAGVLTQYGRGQADILLRMPYGEVHEASRSADFLWYFRLPDWLAFDISHRDAVAITDEPESAPSVPHVDVRFLLMELDARAHITVSRFRASGSIGYLHEGGERAWITHDPNGDNLVSREHWLGVDLGD